MSVTVRGLGERRRGAERGDFRKSLIPERCCLTDVGVEIEAGGVMVMVR